MSKLRQQLLEELVLRGCSARTQEAYLQKVYQLAKHFRPSPDQLANEQVRAYLLHLARERQLAPSSINQAVCALRFLYERVLHREVAALHQALPFTRKPILRPQVYSTAELERLFTLEAVNASAAVFDVKKLERVNGRMIRRLLASDLAARIAPMIAAAQ